MSKFRRVSTNIALIVVVSVVGLELLSFLLLYSITADLIESRVKVIRPPSQIVEQISQSWVDGFYRRSFDPILGWVPPPSATGRQVNVAGQEWQWSTDALGARLDPHYPASLTPYVAAFGDSWTFGDEVSDADTWPAQLSRNLQRHVANYGVRGYGTGQALLRYKRALEKGLRPTYAVLAIFGENLFRVVNRFRPFYYPKGGLLLGFKPRAVLSADKTLAFLPSLLTTKEYDKERLIGLVTAARRGDYWAQYRPWFEFPYALNALRLVRDGPYGGLSAFCTRNQTIPTCNWVRSLSWDSAESQALMTAIIAEFVDVSRREQVNPIILFLSLREVPLYAGFIEKLRQIHRDDGIPIIDLADADIDRETFRILPNRGHPSATGQRAIADQVVRYFRNPSSE